MIKDYNISKNTVVDLMLYTTIYNYDNKKYCYYKYGIISEEQTRAQLGQYIVNTLTPKGSVGY